MYNRESDGNFVNLQEKISLLTKHEHQQRQQPINKSNSNVNDDCNNYYKLKIIL